MTKDSEAKDLLFAIFIVIGIFVGFNMLLSMYLDSISDYNVKLRELNEPTHYEYRVISVNTKDTWYGEEYFEITYLGENNTLSRTRFKYDSNLELVISDNNTFIVENPEPNGYKSRYILYWNGRLK